MLSEMFVQPCLVQRGYPMTIKEQLETVEYKEGAVELVEGCCA